MNNLNVTNLFTRYLERQTGAAREGLALPDLGDATPHDLTPVQPIDPQLAWNDAQLAGQLLGPGGSYAAPAEWPTLVNVQEPAMAVAFALGNYPQQVRHLNALLAGAPISLASDLNGPNQPDLIEWAEQCDDEDGPRLMAAGVLRLARHYQAAARLLAEPVDPEWEMVRLNEQAALAWHQGQSEQAIALWRALPPSAPVAFNLGLALLVADQPAAAIQPLKEAAGLLPETSAWHHLASLYRTLAETRG
jgi:tetratricopeptide (TPR) repeat protein